jgi:hypothetical protein
VNDDECSLSVAGNCMKDDAPVDTYYDERTSGPGTVSSHTQPALYIHIALLLFPCWDQSRRCGRIVVVYVHSRRRYGRRLECGHWRQPNGMKAITPLLGCRY